MLTHWKTALKNVHGLDLIILLKNKKFYKFWTNESFDVSLVLMVIACYFVLFLQCLKYSSKCGNIFDFFVMHFQLENAPRVLKTSPKFYVFHAMTKSTIFTNGVRLVVA